MRGHSDRKIFVCDADVTIRVAPLRLPKLASSNAWTFARLKLLRDSHPCKSDSEQC
jgi:hypothetical protein